MADWIGQWLGIAMLPASLALVVVWSVFWMFVEWTP